MSADQPETPQQPADVPLEFHGRPVHGRVGTALLVGPAPATPTSNDRAALVRALALILVAQAKRDSATPLADDTSSAPPSAEEGSANHVDLR